MESYEAISEEKFVRINESHSIKRIRRVRELDFGRSNNHFDAYMYHVKPLSTINQYFEISEFNFCNYRFCQIKDGKYYCEKHG